jgi:hypothetical protein
MPRSRTTTTKPQRKKPSVRGNKGGATGLQPAGETLKRTVNINVRRHKLNNRPLQDIVDKTIKTTQKIGMKGGIAALAGGAAGIAIGAMITNRNNHKMANQLADNARSAAEEISKRAKALKEAVDGKA